MRSTRIRALHAEAVSLRVAHDRPLLAELTDFLRSRRDEPSTEPEESLDLRCAVRNVDVEMNRQLDGGRPRELVESELGTIAVGEPIVAPTLAAVLEQLRPELGEPLGVVAGKGDVVQPQHRANPFMYTRAPPPRVGKPPTTLEIDDTRLVRTRL